MSRILRIRKMLDERCGRKEWGGPEPAIDELILTMSFSEHYREELQRSVRATARALSFVG